MLHWPALPTFGLVLGALGTGYGFTRQGVPPDPSLATVRPPRWDIPVRMVATAVVLALTSLAPVIGAHLAGLLSPFPVFGVVLAVFTHHAHGRIAATMVFDGLMLGLAAPAVFFLALALALPVIGLPAFGVATAAALATQALTMFAMPALTD